MNKAVTVFCPHCGILLTEDDIFGTECGICGGNIFWETFEEYIDDPESEKDVLYGNDGGS